MRSFLVLSLLALPFAFFSCTKKEFVQPNRTILATLEPGNWKYDASSNTYYNELSVPEIDENVVQTSGILVYITFDDTLYEALPDVLDGVSFIYRYEQGKLYVESQKADGSSTLPPASPINVKIVLIASQPE